MKKKSTKKLVLAKETVQLLMGVESRQAVGGTVGTIFGGICFSWELMPWNSDCLCDGKSDIAC